MCIGLPYQVIQTTRHKAYCQRKSDTRWIDTSLVGEVRNGDWLLVFLDAAREILTEQRAQQVEDAVNAIEQVMLGESVNLENCFKDLVESEPQLPEHLKPLLK